MPQTPQDLASWPGGSIGHHGQVSRLVLDALSAKYGLPIRYREQRAAAAFIDNSPTGVVYQPDVYRLAGYLQRVGALRRVVDIGCGTARVLRQVVPQQAIVGIDYGQNLQVARAALPAATFIEHDLDASEIDLPQQDLDESVVISSDVIEHLRRPHLLLNTLARAAQTAPFVLISTPDRTRCRGIGHMGPPDNVAHVREWSADEFCQWLAEGGLDPQLFGYTLNTTRHRWKSTLLSVHGTHARYAPSPAKSCLAIVSTYNDADFLPSLVGHLLAQGIYMYFVDNWSDDGSFEWLKGAKRQHGDRIVGVERFPAGAPSKTYRWHAILDRKADIAASSAFDWIFHYDSDELRESPWRGVSLADAVSFVDARGYNAIDHAVVDFRATEDGFSANHDARDFFHFCEFGRRSGHFLQIKGWKNTNRKVELCESGGHQARFNGQRVFPLKFLLKHYPLRSLEQMQRKIFTERHGRFDPQERARGWHAQYDAYAGGQYTLQLWDPTQLIAYNPNLFGHEYLVERLSSIGLEKP